MMFFSRVSQSGQKGLFYSDLETGLLDDSYGCLGDVHDTSIVFGHETS